MMQRIAAFSVDDLLLDSNAVADALMHDCRRGDTPMYVRGVCQIQDTVYFTLLPCRDSGSQPVQYVWVECADTTDAGITSLLEERWAAGFDLVGSVDGDEDLVFLLFAKNPKDGR
jgi:hypothetical protein